MNPFVFSYIVDQGIEADRAESTRPLFKIWLSKLPVRVKKTIHNLGITSYQELISKTCNDFAMSRQFGATSLDNLRIEMWRLGLHLKDDSLEEVYEEHKYFLNKPPRERKG